MYVFPKFMGQRVNRLEIAPHYPVETPLTNQEHPTSCE